MKRDRFVKLLKKNDACRSSLRWAGDQNKRGLSPRGLALLASAERINWLYARVSDCIPHEDREFIRTTVGFEYDSVYWGGGNGVSNDAVYSLSAELKRAALLDNWSAVEDTLRATAKR